MNNQLSLYEQLLRVRTLANKHGYYDAADFIQRNIEDIEKSFSNEICQEEVTMIKSLTDVSS